MAHLDEYILFFGRPFDSGYTPESFKTAKAALKYVRKDIRRLKKQKMASTNELVAVYKKISLDQLKEDK